MSFYIYRRASSDSARALTNALGGIRCVGENGAPRRLARATQADRAIFWGDATVGLPQGVKSLNNISLGNKLTDAKKLAAAGVATIEIFEGANPPQPPPQDDGFNQLAEELREQAFEFGETNPDRGSVPYRRGVEALHQGFARFRELLAHPPVAAAQIEWLKRLKNHVGGNDLLNPPAQGDYWVKKEQIAKEFRVHSFLGRSIRAGMKVPRDGYDVPGGIIAGIPQAHKWIRSWDGGWRISYDGDSVRQKHRDIAHAAVKALGLDFGAVDIAERPDGSVFVLEVNRAPGIEAGTIEAYANAIKRWAEGGA